MNSSEKTFITRNARMEPRGARPSAPRVFRPGVRANPFFLITSEEIEVACESCVNRVATFLVTRARSVRRAQRKILCARGKEKERVCLAKVLDIMYGEYVRVQRYFIES